MRAYLIVAVLVCFSGLRRIGNHKARKEAEEQAYRELKKVEHKVDLQERDAELEAQMLINKVSAVSRARFEQIERIKRGRKSIDKS